MPTWGQILDEIKQTTRPGVGGADFDGVRRKYLKQLAELTGRNTVIYYTDWLSGHASANTTSIALEDLTGLMECYHGLQGDAVDLILHSPGGEVTAAASLAQYTRKKFSDVRVIVPQAAMSAATMWSLSANCIVMGKHSQLGPIDPQLPLGQNMVPAVALIEQFKTAKSECVKDPRVLSVWLPTLQQYYPGLLEICSEAIKLGRKLVTEWLTNYMFLGDIDAASHAEAVARYFSDEHRVHSLGIDRIAAQAKQLKIVDLESSDEFQDAVLSVHHAAMHTLSLNPTVKIMENHVGRTYVKIEQPQMSMMPVMIPQPPQPQKQPPQAPPPPTSKAIEP